MGAEMKVLVTGVAGFIGSHVAERALADGYDVVGIDVVSDYYSVAQKRSNLAALIAHPRFSFVEGDLLVVDLRSILDGVSLIFHQAGQPGVRSSWGDGFNEYVANNVLVTQRLLEAARRIPLDRFVYASSSSVYGNAPAYPTREDDLPNPQSPYGVTKLAAEHLCGVYGRNFDVPTVMLRYFTVYGPRQRPDMATHRLIEAALAGRSFSLFGDGSKIRDFTYVADVVAANFAAATSVAPAGSVVNVAGGSSATMSELIDLVSSETGTPVRVQREPDADGDVDRTGGSIDRANDVLMWKPQVSLAEGVHHQVDWHKSRLEVRP